MRPDDTFAQPTPDSGTTGTTVPTCPECGEPVQPVPPTVPAAWTAHGRPMPLWSHLDGQPLCPVVGPHGYQPADPT